MERPRLLRAIEESDARVVVLVAPAGYGKTVLARQWAENRTGETFWYGASGRSADVAALVNDLLGVLQLPSEVAAALRESVRATRPTVETARFAAAALADALAPRSPDSWLVIDDYHLIGADETCECFIETLVERDPLALLLATRERPRWLTSRRMVYREALEITADNLAMSEAEVQTILQQTPAELPYTWSDLAEGWPAVVGLAMHGRHAALPPGQIAQTLYDFLASELYSNLSGGLQRAAQLLAIPERLKPLVCRFLLGTGYTDTLADLEVAGFVSMGREAAIHPLLRHYLRHLGREDSELRSTADRLVQFLVQARSYDDAFAVIETHGQTSHLAELLNASFRELMAGGRDSSLERWVALARTSGVDDAIVDLVDAELAYRRGELARADALARRSASRDSLVRARALLVAGRTAHMRSDEQGAFALLQEALELPVDERDRADLEWYQFILASELEREEAAQLLETYAKSAAGSFDQHVRLLNGKGVLASQLGGVGEALLRPREIMELARHTTEPVIRCGFMNRYSLLLWAHAQYAEALEVLDAEIQILRATRLEFAIPHALALQASAEVGLRRYKRSDATIRTVLALEPRDRYIRMELASIRARALCAQGRADAAVAITSADWSDPPNRALYGEYLSTRALALAADGKPESAVQAAADAEAATTTAETLTRVALARALLSTHEAACDRAQVRAATAIAWSSGHLDAFVCAYRACPRLLANIQPADPHYSDVAALLVRLGDERFARAGGFDLSETQPAAGLTRREDEVLQLLADGLTNKQIAGRLFISEVTVKVHVSRILAKLGVGSRTEAAIRFLEDGFTTPTQPLPARAADGVTLERRR